MGEIKTRRQSIDFLGFLRSQLSGLQGIPTLCYELIQNADDVKDEEGNPGGASRITFDVCDDALYVENDGLFREIDFERMENVSWGNKREEAETTGAFGIGFISVYQITDSPEIFSSGQHWRFQPQAKEDQRILVQEEETQFTRFRLPWAYKMSKVRQELGIPPVRKDHLALVTHQLIVSIESAALFLKQVHILEVKRSGEIFHRIEVIKEGNWLLLDNGKQITKWCILEGEFRSNAIKMRTEYGELIEDKRRPVVQLAIPEKPLKNGLLYAFLPSETSTGLPFHINADFYPSSDRKRILLENDFKSEWNNYAIECAAETLTENIDEVLEIFTRQVPVFWDFAEQIKHASDEVPSTPVFEKFWEKIKIPIGEKPTVLTTSGQMVAPYQAVFLDSEAQKKASLILEDLGIFTTHPDLRSHRNLLLETGARLLKVSDIAEALQTEGLDKRTELVNMPAKLRYKAGWSKFWLALNNLWDNASYTEKQNAEIILKGCAIAFGSDGALWPPASLYQADSKTQRLFSKFSSIVWFIQKDDRKPLPVYLVPEFLLQNGLEVLERVQGTLPEAWVNGAFSPQEIHDWLELRRPKIAQDLSAQQFIRKLAIWPNANGELQPLESLYVAGDFEDPLHLAQLVDIGALGGRREFLENELGVNQLDFVTYVRDWLPSAFKTSKLDQKNRFRLLKVLAENLGKLQGQKDLQEILSDLPLVWCGDDSFLTAPKVYFDSKEVRNVLGKETPLAQLPPKKADAIRVLYEWLGVVKDPLPEDIITYIHNLVSSPPQSTSLKKIKEIFSFLANKWDLWTEETQGEFRQLQDEKWLPGSKKPDEWFHPTEVYAIFRKFLFESQGNFLEVDLKVQRKASDLIEFLNVNGEPSIEQVIKHLLFCSERNKPITQEVYVYLTQKADNPAIQVLCNKPCLYLELPTGFEYFYPNHVFWEQHPFGSYRARLGPEFGRFKDLFDNLGVKEKPDDHDAIAVLREIAEVFAKSDIQFEDESDTGRIVIMCWKMINSALENEQIEPAAIKKALGNKTTILSSQHTLDFPLHLFFDDRAGLGQKFQRISNNLTRSIEGAWIAMESAGVQRLSKVVTTELLQCDNPNKDIDLEARLSERIPLILRVIEAHHLKGVKDFDLEILKDLSFSKTDRIEIVRVFNGLGFQERSLPEEVDAIHLDGELYFCSDDGKYPWQSISRELSYVLHPSGELSSLGLELKEIFSQSVEEANLSLDEYGYPRVEQGPKGIPDGLTAKPGTETGSSETDEKEGSQGEGGGSSGSSSSAPSKKSKNKARKKSRLVSYVYLQGEGGNGDEPKPTDPEAAFGRTRIGELGVAHVMNYEIEHGRTPTDMETIQVHHPGYDIKSVDEKGQTRYIEVKSFSGFWDIGNPAQMTKTEFENARELGASYWLYVVEEVESEDFKINAICNPANRADYYAFDNGWQPLSEYHSFAN